MASVARAGSAQPWWSWTQDHVEARIRFLREVVGAAIVSERDDFQEALDKRDREIKSLRREVQMLRDEVGLERGLAALKAEVVEARQVQPTYDNQLNDLQSQVEKLQKQTIRVRAEQSTLAYKQQHLSTVEFTHRRATSIKLTNIGEQTRQVLQRLRENGFDLVDEMRSPSGQVS